MRCEGAVTCIITADVDRLVFYEAVTGLAATHYTLGFAEIPTPGATLAIESKCTPTLFGAAAVAEAAANRSAIIAFHVDDVDAEHVRIGSSTDGTVVQPPPTMSSGNCSPLLRNPDDTLVNLFAPVTAEAKLH